MSWGGVWGCFWGVFSIKISKSLSQNNQHIYFLSAVPALWKMYTNKDSNLFSYLRNKNGEDCIRLLRKWEITIKKMQIIEIIEGSHSNVSRQV